MSNLSISVFARNQFEATHNWPDCNVDEVAYLRNEHRHVFHIESHKVVDHDNRDTEFIVLKHRVQELLEEWYPDHKLGSTSCEMLATRLVGALGLSKCMVSEDNENGAWVEVV